MEDPDARGRTEADWVAVVEGREARRRVEARETDEEIIPPWELRSPRRWSR